MTIGFLEISFVDLLDILLVSFMMFQIYKLMKGSIAVKVFVGFLFLYLIYLLVKAMNMDLISTILGQFMGVGVLAAIILFQQEIRKFLLLLGKTTAINDINLFRQVFSSWTQKEIGKTDMFSHFSDPNVIDKQVVSSNPWMMYTCAKPNCKPYLLSRIDSETL